MQQRSCHPGPVLYSKPLHSCRLILGADVTITELRSIGFGRLAEELQRCVQLMEKTVGGHIAKLELLRTCRRPTRKLPASQPSCMLAFRSAAVVELLAAAAPGAATVADTVDLPIHHAAMDGDVAMLQLLLLIAPATAAARAAMGSTALHLAARGGDLEVAVKMLLEVAPETAMAVDSDGQVPLHTAA